MEGNYSSRGGGNDLFQVSSVALKMGGTRSHRPFQ